MAQTFKEKNGLAGLTVLVDPKLKRKARHILMDKNISLAAWISKALEELVEASVQPSQIHTVLHELQVK